MALPGYLGLNVIIQQIGDSSDERRFTTPANQIWQMKSLLTITGLVEGITGLLLAIMPSFVASLLLGSSLTDPIAVLISRLAGPALITIAIACLLSKNEIHLSIMTKVMLGYNILSTIILLYAVLIERIAGPGLWPAVIVHLGLLIWCAREL